MVENVNARSSYGANSSTARRCLVVTGQQRHDIYIQCQLVRKGHNSPKQITLSNNLIADPRKQTKTHALYMPNTYADGPTPASFWSMC